MPRLDARWGNFSDRSQSWTHFWQDGEPAAPPAGGDKPFPYIGGGYYGALLVLAMGIDALRRWVGF